MKSLLIFAVLVNSAFATTIRTEKSTKSIAYVNSQKIEIRFSKKVKLIGCDDQHLYVALNRVNYADQSSSGTALAKAIFAAEASDQRVGEIGCEDDRVRTKTVYSRWTSVNFKGERHVNMIEVFHPAETKIEIKEL